MEKNEAMIEKLKVVLGDRIDQQSKNIELLLRKPAEIDCQLDVVENGMKALRSDIDTVKAVMNDMPANLKAEIEAEVANTVMTELDVVDIVVQRRLEAVAITGVVRMESEIRSRM